MARMEEVSQGNFVRLPDKTQQEIIKILNKYFSSDLADIENSKEGIIVEIQQRLKPLIINLVRTIIMEEGADLFEPIINDKIEEEFKKFEEEIERIIEDIKNSISKNEECDYKVTSDIQNVPLMTTVKFKTATTTTIVSVNGMIQSENENFTKLSDADGNLVGIRFDEALSAPDFVKVICFAYM